MDKSLTLFFLDLTCIELAKSLAVNDLGSSFLFHLELSYVATRNLFYSHMVGQCYVLRGLYM